MFDDERDEPDEIFVRIRRRGRKNGSTPSLSWKRLTWVLRLRKPSPIGITGVRLAIVSRNSNAAPAWCCLQSLCPKSRGLVFASEPFRVEWAESAVSPGF